MIKKKKKKSNS